MGSSGGLPGPLEVDPEGEGRRLDAWLAVAAGISRSVAGRLIEQGLVTVDGAAAAKSLRLSAGQRVLVDRPAPPPPAPTAPFEVRFEDEHVAVVAKPAGVVVHPAPGLADPTLVDALRARMPLAPAAGEDRPGIVHRLDRDTSGLLVVAKTDAAYRGLVSAMQTREVRRRYLALVLGEFSLPAGRIEAPVGRAPRIPTRMTVTPEGREAVTQFRVLEALGRVALLEVHLGTGRTHQIRVHLEHIGHPVVGDPTYGRRAHSLQTELGLERPFLHAAGLSFDHPVLAGVRVDVSEPLPPDLEAALERARRAAG
ncbi:MAG: RluA family pseudouridine synthase [Actinomycetota bacterium]